MKEADVTYMTPGPDLCTMALEECIHRGLPAAWIYTLRVGPSLLTSARGLIRFLADGSKDNPFVPQINIILEQGYRGQQWAIEAGGVAFGSMGW